jgi:hypothetical protein
MPSPQFPLPQVNQAWIDPENGQPTQTFYQFMAHAFPAGVNTLASVLELVPKLFRQLPSKAMEGMLASVIDSTTNTWGATIAGGGGFHVLAYYDGNAWTVAGK